MSVWEYASAHIVYEWTKEPGSRDKYWWWHASVNGTDTFGMGKILNAWGAKGWELISVIPTQ